jgi:Zn-dependent alcohol dehydrogenase
LPLMMETLVKKQGKVPYERIVSHTYPLADVNRAFADAEWHEHQTGVSRAMLVP